ncbi:hypothetical protein GYMLUDRAFT_785504 [Collybiopsis luxurians FD-317 M1]|nr:hypothetical protein GYMLUDRAFT_785504 [Collybiopsis luxurians FD-317 M1]
MVVARAIRPYPITKERHQVLGPWVLKNMMPPVDPVSLQRHVKAKRLGRADTPNTSDEYDFLLTRSTPSCVPSRPAKIRDFGDLNSDQVSQLVNDGMSFWAREDDGDESNELPPSPAPPDGDIGGDSSRSTDELVLKEEMGEM